MAWVLRRCLDCDQTYTANSQCPLCGSVKSLILVTDANAGQGYAHSGAWLLIIHGLLMTAITAQHPGFLIGTLLFAGGLCGFLILAEVENALRIARSVAALAMTLHLLYALTTGQNLLFLPSALLLLIVLLLFHHDTSAPWLPSMRITGWLVLLTLAGIAVLATYRGPLPGWWSGRHLPWQDLARPPDVGTQNPSGLPTLEPQGR